MRADRLLKLMMLLQANGKMTTRVLAQDLEVSRRTVLRDIDALSYIGVPVYAEGGHGGGVSLDEKYRIKLNGLNQVEVQALILSGNAVLLADIGMDNAAEQSLLKLLTALPSLHIQAAKDIQNRVYIDPLAWWRHEYDDTHLKTLQVAVYETRPIHITYQKHDGTVSNRHVEPYGLVAKASVWYLIAQTDGAYRTYRVSRIRDVRFSDETFIRDTTFDLKTYWHAHMDSFLATMPAFTFTLKVAPRHTHFIQSYVPGAHELLETDDDGWFTARFTVENQDVAAMIVFGLGEDAQILEPRSLIDAIIRKSEAVLRTNKSHQ